MRVLENAPDIMLVRRCADLAELLSAGAAGVGRVVVVSPDLRGLDREALRHLAGHGMRVAGLVGPGDDEGERRLRQLGVATILAPRTTRRRARALSVWRTRPRRRIVVRRPPHSPESGADGRLGRRAPGPAGDFRAAMDRSDEEPGRPAAAHSGHRGVGADRGPGPHYGGGHPRRATGRRRACAPCSSTSTPGAPAWPRCSGWSTRRPGSRRRPGPPSRAPSTCPGLARLAPEVVPGLRVLTGLPRADRWPELRAAAVEDVLRPGARGRRPRRRRRRVRRRGRRGAQLRHRRASSQRRHPHRARGCRPPRRRRRGRPGRAAAAGPGGPGRRRAAVAAAHGRGHQGARLGRGSRARARHRRRPRPVRRHGGRALPAVGSRRVRRGPARRPLARRGRAGAAPRAVGELAAQLDPRRTPLRWSAPGAAGAQTPGRVNAAGAALGWLEGPSGASPLPRLNAATRLVKRTGSPRPASTHGQGR